MVGQGPQGGRQFSLSQTAGPVCSIRTNKGGEIVETVIPCTN